MSLEKTFRMRAVQLDLARQPETCDFIKYFIDFIHRHGFNTLVMYLEGRVRTSVFHHLPEDASYSPEQLRDIVAYAADREIEVIPVVSMLGHAELFLEVPEFEYLAELRGKITGRFNKFQHVFCASLPEVLEFLEQYVTEVASIFPSEYFHAGFDEAWDIGYCELCRPRLEKEGQGGIFAEHLLKCHRIVTEKLHKKMMVWDDMFELYPHALEMLPRDVILCSWHYEPLLEEPFGHTGAPRMDLLAKYERMGFRYLFAPATHFWRNIETFTAYAQKANSMGGLLTSWSVGTPLWLPEIAACGMLWSKGSCDLSSIIREVVDTSDPMLVKLLAMAFDVHPIPLPGSASAYLKGPLSDTEYAGKLQNELALTILKDAQSEPVRESVAIDLNLDRIYFRLRALIPEWYGLAPECGAEEALREEFRAVREDVAALQDRYGSMRERCFCLREPVDRNALPFQRLKTMLDQFLSEPRPVTKAYLRMRFPFSSNLAVRIRFRGGTDYRTVWSGGCGQRPFLGEFQTMVPMEPGVPESVRVEQNGYVGAPLSYLEVISEGVRYVPSGLSSVEGAVFAPTAVVEDGRDWCYLGDGEQKARRKFLAPVETQAKNCIEIVMKPYSI